MPETNHIVNPKADATDKPQSTDALKNAASFLGTNALPKASHKNARRGAQAIHITEDTQRHLHLRVWRRVSVCVCVCV